MTAGHTVLAIGFTVYVFIAVRCEERDLACRYGSSYGRWRSSLATRGTSTEPRKAAAV
jgi:protein-S-isoprenylcysteine O-methyltransferase Ste14